MWFQGLFFVAVFLGLVFSQEIADDVFLSPHANDVLQEGVPYTVQWNLSSPAMLQQDPGVLLELVLYHSNGTEQDHEQVPNNGTYDWIPKVGLGGGKYYFQILGSEKVEELILSEEFTIVESGESVTSSSTISGSKTVAASTPTSTPTSAECTDESVSQYPSSTPISSQQEPFKTSRSKTSTKTIALAAALGGSAAVIISIVIAYLGYRRGWFTRKATVQKSASETQIVEKADIYDHTKLDEEFQGVGLEKEDSKEYYGNPEVAS